MLEKFHVCETDQRTPELQQRPLPCRNEQLPELVGSVGRVASDAITGVQPPVLALNVNNGIQAFTVAVPEPSAFLALLGGMAGLVGFRRMRSAQRA